MSKKILFVAILLLPQLLYGQQYYFRNLNLEHGLPQSQAYDIVQSSRGIIWIATNGGGACRYLGNSFEVVNQQRGLIDDHVRRIFEDSKGNLWFATYYGLTKFDGRSYSSIGVDQGFVECVYLDIYESDDGKIWLYLQHDQNESGIYYVDENRLVNFSKKNKSIQSDSLESLLYRSSLFQLPDKSFLVQTKHGLKQIHKDLSIKNWVSNTTASTGLTPLLVRKNNSILFTNGNELLEFDGSTFKKVFFPSTLTVGNILQATEGLHHELWFAVNHVGLVRIQKDGSYQIFDDKNGFEGSDSYIYKLYTDREGSIWIGTSNKGIFQFIDDRFLQFNLKDGLSSLDVTTLFKVNDGVAIGLSDGNVFKVDSLGSQLLVNGKDSDLGIVKTGVEIGDEIWLGTASGLQAWKKGKITNKGEGLGVSNLKRVSSIAFQDSVIWISSNEIGLIKVQNNKIEFFDDSNSDLPSNDVRYIFIDSKNRIWICTNFGLAKINAEGKPEVVRLPGTNQKTLIFQATEDAFGNLWFATFGQGLIYFDGVNFKSVSTKNGLASNIIYSIASQGNNLWCSVQNALHKLSVTENGVIESIETFNEKNGFLGYEGNGASILSLPNGQIWVGTIKGAFVYSPTSKVESSAVEATLQSIKLFYADVDWQSETYKKYYQYLSEWRPIPMQLELPHQQNHITFSVAIPSYRYPASIKMQWKLIGSQTKWSPLSTTREIVFSDLDPGDYSLEVRIQNESGELSQAQKIFSFTILPPFYQTWWFTLLLAILIVSSLVLIIRGILRRRYIAELKRMEALQQVQQERQRIARDLHDHVGSQLTYIINGLDSVSVKQEEPESKGRISELSKFAREAIHQLRETIWATHKESFTVIELEQRLRRLAWLNMEHDGTPQILVQTSGDLNIMLRPVQVLNLFRIAQEAINNAMRHSRCNQILITITVEATRLKLVVEDDGVGIDDKGKNGTEYGGFGFSSMKQRVVEIGGELIIQSAKGKGTKIEIRISPYNHLK